MKNLFSLLIKGIGAALSTFAILGIFWDIKTGGTYAMTHWGYTKMVIATIIVGVGYSIPALIYYSPNIPYPIKILFHMGIGSGIFIVVSFVVGWIPKSLGIKWCIIAIFFELLLAFILWFCFSLHYKRMAKKMNERIKSMEL